MLALAQGCCEFGKVLKLGVMRSSAQLCSAVGCSHLWLFQSKSYMGGNKLLRVLAYTI
jgi:hypothetical protein